MTLGSGKSGRIRALWILPYYDRGGMERMSMWLTAALSEWVDVTVVLINIGDLKWPAAHPAKLEIVFEDQTRIRKRPFHVMRRLIALARNSDVVIGSLELTVTYVSWMAATIARKPYVAMVHSTFAEWIEEAKYGRGHYWLSRLTYRCGTRIVANSQAVSDHIASVFWAPRRKISVIYPPVPIEEVTTQAADEPEWVSPSGRPYLVGVGRLEYEKGFDILLRAYSEMARPGRPDLVLIGEGTKRDELLNQARQLGVSDSLHLPGYLPNPYPIVRGAAAFVSSSRWEGFGIALVEAMALGVPAIATDIGPSKEISSGGDAVHLVPSGDTTALAKAMGTVLDDAALRSRLTANGLSRSAEFSLETASRDWLRLLNRVAMR